MFSKQIEKNVKKNKTKKKQKKKTEPPIQNNRNIPYSIFAGLIGQVSKKKMFVLCFVINVTDLLNDDTF